MTVLVATALVLGGCAAGPEVEPSATPLFASDAEAFEAAEETYRAYVDALNQVDLSDPATFEAVYAWTTGEANAAARESFSQMHADGWVVSGQSDVDSVDFKNTYGEEIVIYACLHVLEVELTDASGASVVTPDRPATQSFEVSLSPSATTPSELAIYEFSGAEPERCL